MLAENEDVGNERYQATRQYPFSFAESDLGIPSQKRAKASETTSAQHSVGNSPENSSTDQKR